MNTLFRLVLLLLLVLVFVSCDVIESPYAKNIVPIEVDSTTPKILLEDFTAQRCINCPAGASVYHGLQAQYPGKIIVVSIHGGSQAIPDSEFPNDFRTEVGSRLIYDYDAEIIGMPCALVSRRSFEGKLAMDRMLWSGAIAAYWANHQTTPLRIALPSAELLGRTITCSVQLDYLEPSINPHSVCVWLLEDGIVGKQMSIEPPYELPDYVHNNVLRAAFGGAYGESVGEGALPAGHKWNKTFSYTIPADKSWNTSKLRVVAFVYDATTKEVKQAEEAAVVITE